MWHERGSFSYSRGRSPGEHADFTDATSVPEDHVRRLQGSAGRTIRKLKLRGGRNVEAVPIR
jgi:hypothetical protein